MVGETDDATEAEDFGHWVLDQLASIFVDDAEYGWEGLASRLTVGPFCQPLSLGVDEGDASFGIAHHDRVANASEGGGEELFFAQKRFARRDEVGNVVDDFGGA